MLVYLSDNVLVPRISHVKGLHVRAKFLPDPDDRTSSIVLAHPASSFVPFSHPVRQVSLQTRRGLTLLLASSLNALKPRFPIRWCQCPRPSDPFCRHLYSVIGACQWGAFLESILRGGDRLGSGCNPFLQHGQAGAIVSVSVVYTCWEFQVAAGLLFRTLSCQVMLSMRRRQRIWKVVSFLSVRVWRVHDSLSCSNVLKTQVL